MWVYPPPTHTPQPLSLAPSLLLSFSHGLSYRATSRDAGWKLVWELIAFSFTSPTLLKCKIVKAKNIIVSFFKYWIYIKGKKFGQSFESYKGRWTQPFFLFSLHVKVSREISDICATATVVQYRRDVLRTKDIQFMICSKVFNLICRDRHPVVWYNVYLNPKMLNMRCAKVNAWTSAANGRPAGKDAETCEYPWPTQFLAVDNFDSR